MNQCAPDITGQQIITIFAKIPRSNRWCGGNILRDGTLRSVSRRSVSKTSEPAGLGAAGKMDEWEFCSTESRKK
jgi:hypothetical protein